MVRVVKINCDFCEAGCLEQNSVNRHGLDCCDDCLLVAFQRMKESPVKPHVVVNDEGTGDISATNSKVDELMAKAGF